MCPCCVASFILVPVSGHKRLRTNGRHVLRQMLPALSAMAVFEEALGCCWLAAIVADIGSVLSQMREVCAGIYLLRDLSPRTWLCNGKLSLTTAFVACGVGGCDGFACGLAWHVGTGGREVTDRVALAMLSRRLIAACFLGSAPFFQRRWSAGLYQTNSQVSFESGMLCE